MVFTSIPAAYLDAANWQQQQQQQQPNHQPSNTGSQQLLPPPVPPQPPIAQPHGASTGGAGTIRPGSMVDRARMANLPMPEAALKCPRCESTNTKFCYFNNYSLSQPRHFCKTCRRYWTRNGALRNVPVGGGCRRNKRSKGSGGNSSRSSPASSDRQTTGSTNSTNSVSSNSASSVDLAGFSPHLPPLRFMAPLHHHQLTDFTTTGGDHMALNYGLNYGGVGDLSFQIGNALGGGGSGGGGSSSILEQWRVPQTTQQFPFLAGLEGSSQAAGGDGSGAGLYPFGGNSADVTTTGYGAALRPKVSVSTSGMLTQLASVKMEDNRELSFLLGSNNNNNVQVSSGVDQHQQFWMTAGTSSSTAAWTDHLSGFSSSSTTSNNQL